MILKFIESIIHLVNLRQARLAIVRRYVDMNNRNVGELYLQENGSYRLVGMSLDTFPRFWSGLSSQNVFKNMRYFDTDNDFAAFLPIDSVRVGGDQPQNNEQVRELIRSLPRWRRELIINNGFVDCPANPLEPSR